MKDESSLYFKEESTTRVRNKEEKQTHEFRVKKFLIKMLLSAYEECTFHHLACGV